MKILKTIGIVLVISLSVTISEAASIKPAGIFPQQTPPPPPPAPHKLHKPPFHKHLKWQHHRVHLELPKLPPHPTAPPPPPAPPVH